MNKDIILHSDAYAGIKYLEDNSITAVITSPPYWKQRNYGFVGQIGQENTAEEYIGRLLKIFNKLKEKLKDNGVFFLNIGDKYLKKYGKSRLLQIPYRLAYHMIKKGWLLEDVIIWYKPNHMPSSVKDRFTNTYEPIFVFAKQRENIYNKNFPKVVEIKLQQTEWKHTSVFPEFLVLKMLERIELKEGDVVLDPFAGTGTTAVVVSKMRNELTSKKIYSILIEKSNDYIKIIKKRTLINNIVKINDVNYEWEPIKEDELPENVKPHIVLTNKYGEVYIAKEPYEFLSSLKGINTNEFKEFHREDALFFFGIKNWDLNSLYYVNNINQFGYLLRNMLVITDGNYWYPVFMFVKNSTKVEYRFNLDKIRLQPKIKEKRNWFEENFIGMNVKYNSSKTPLQGYIIKILEKYEDGFPKIVIVQWNDKLSVEIVIHPEKDDFLMESLKFLCPKCKNKLLNPYDPLGKNLCPICNQELWRDTYSIPIIQEPKEVIDIIKITKNKNYSVNQILYIEKLNSKKTSKSKFLSLEKINWGASPGARKLIVGEYFTKMRLYKIKQPLVAHYLTLLIKSKGIKIKDLVEKFPREYYYTIGHWFRKDFGGSIPLPQDIELLQEILNIEDDFLTILKRTALKFQTVKTSIKGKNPGDYFMLKNDNDLFDILKSLFDF